MLCISWRKSNYYTNWQKIINCNPDWGGRATELFKSSRHHWLYSKASHIQWWLGEWANLCFVKFRAGNCNIIEIGRNFDTPKRAMKKYFNPSTVVRQKWSKFKISFITFSLRILKTTHYTTRFQISIVCYHFLVVIHLQPHQSTYKCVVCKYVNLSPLIFLSVLNRN